MTRSVHSRQTVSRSARLVIAGAMACVALTACPSSTHGDRASAAAGSMRDSTVAAVPRVAPTAAHDASMEATPVPALADTLDPAATLRAYLARARMRSATRDTLLWEPATDGTSGFRAFHDSTIATFTIGTAGRIEGAAGSRYVTIPIDVDVTTRAAPVTLHGIATLRRAVVDGATDAQRRWRIVRIDWSAR